MGNVFYALGFVALLLAPTLSIYAIGAFATWDLTWIADDPVRDGRTAIAIVQAIWVIILGIAASGS